MNALKRPLVGVNEAAALLGCTAPTGRNYALRGDLPHILTPFRHRLFDVNDLEALKACLAARRDAVRAAMTEYRLSERRSCALVTAPRSTCRYTMRRDPATALRDRLRALAEQRRRFGYRRLTVLLRREGLRVNHKRVYRLYRAEGLVGRRRKRKRCARPAQPPVVPAVRLNQRWAMDFMKDQLTTAIVMVERS